MVKGGVEYDYEVVRAICVISVIVTPILALYSTLVVMGVVPSTHYIGPEATLVICLTWVLVSLYFYFKPSESTRDQAVRLAIIHVFALSMFVFITGFAQPFTQLFALLFLACHLYFGRVG